MDNKTIEKNLELLSSDKVVIKNKPNSIKNKIFKSKKSITVITAVYNASKYIQKCIDSVINQSFSFEQIEFIIVDDCSTDGTKEILEKKARKYSNITAVFLKENTGTAATPRNIGIELATTDRIMFLDADDWLDKDGILKLMEKMDETDADFVIGKSIKVTDDSENVHAEFMSYEERTHLAPHELPYIFYHMGPPSKLVKTYVIKNNCIRFPEMKFGEDKLFFIKVLDKSNSISTITSPIYYINRTTNNKNSLTRVTEMKKKRNADLYILKDILKLNLKTEIEKIVVKRLLEYDFIRSCDSNLFINSKNKISYIEIISEAISIIKELPYDVISNFDNPLYQVGAELIASGKDEDFIKLFSWKRKEKNKHIIIKDNLPYYNISYLNLDQKYILIPLYAIGRNTYVKNDQFVHEFEIYGTKLNTVKNIILRDRKSYTNELNIPIHINGNLGEFRINLETLDVLNNSLFTIFIQYNGHKLINVKRENENTVTYQDREFTFYTTKSNNLGFSLKQKKK